MINDQYYFTFSFSCSDAKSALFTPNTSHHVYFYYKLLYVTLARVFRFSLSLLLLYIPHESLFCDFTHAFDFFFCFFLDDTAETVLIDDARAMKKIRRAFVAVSLNLCVYI